LRQAKTIRIEIETQRSVVFSLRVISSGWCGVCNLDVDLISIAEAVQMAGLAEQMLLQKQHAHVAGGADGQLICLNSLLPQTQTEMKEIRHDDH